MFHFVNSCLSLANSGLVSVIKNDSIWLCVIAGCAALTSENANAVAWIDPLTLRIDAMAFCGIPVMADAFSMMLDALSCLEVGFIFAVLGLVGKSANESDIF